MHAEREEPVRKLILVKHSMPAIVPSLPANRWQLSEEGRRRCRALADRLSAYEPGVIVTSSEPKAVETAEIVSKYLGKSFEVVEGLQEHERSNVLFLTQGEFEDSVANFFEHPSQLVFGEETANQARDRFAKAVTGVLGKYSDESVIVVTHGTVISLFVGDSVEIDPYRFWQQLEMPSFVVLSPPNFMLLKVIGHITDEG